MIAAFLLAIQLPPMDPPAPQQVAPIASGPFTGSMDSLKQNQYPAWFTHGKLGIWAHWGPQAVPMEGDWYARLLYEEGGKDYKDHLARFGHPSKTGYKDIIPLWKAEKWDPEKLMELYKKAGAKYFVSMGVHHDNFDLWNSTYHRWNAVKMGPHRDVVGEWQRAAIKNGLHFGVSEHLGASFTWFQGSHGSDKTGPMAGVPYDGADPAYEDLYHQKALPGDTGWYSNDPRWHAEWYRRIKDLVDQYHPDLLYSDGGMPFGEVGESLVAHFYNSSIANHHGKQEAVYTCKQTSGGRWAQDLERGVQGKIEQYPWQTDTSIGDWFYNRNWKFRGADWVIHTLVDVVSKNGNLLLNVVLKPDGSLDDEAMKVLEDMTAWMKVNSESIYDTTPWISYGEGPTRPKGGSFGEDFEFSGQDVRYVQKGDGVLYATLMGSPASNEITLRSLSAPGAAKVTDVRVLGIAEKPNWSATPTGLKISLPGNGFSKIATVIKITGHNLRDFTIPGPPVEVIEADDHGNFTLTAAKAQTHGDAIQVEGPAGSENLGYWDSPDDWASWKVNMKPGSYTLTALVSAANGPTFAMIGISGTSIGAPIPKTNGWGDYREIFLSEFSMSATGPMEISIKPDKTSGWKPMNLRRLVFHRND